MWTFSSKTRRQKTQKELLVAQKSLSLSSQYQWSAINATAPGVGNDLADDIIVSLTTFDKRIDDVYLTIESLLQQSLKSDRIILWVSEQEFTASDIPHVLRLQERRGLEVRFCPEDLGSYKKYFYTLKQYPQSLILTVDDDILYPHDLVDQLYRNYQRSPNVIHCTRAHGMRLSSYDEVEPYKRWDRPCRDSRPSLLTFPTGMGGVLYFPGCFDEQVLNKDLFMALCPHADDVWLKAMSLKQGILCKKIKDPRDHRLRFPQIIGSQNHSLKRKNKSACNGNDVKLKAVFEHFKLHEKLRQPALRSSTAENYQPDAQVVLNTR